MHAFLPCVAVTLLLAALGPVHAQVSLIPEVAVWKYWDKGTIADTTWNTATFGDGRCGTVANTPTRRRCFSHSPPPCVHLERLHRTRAPRTHSQNNTDA
jgi:hypothetical protein